MLSLQTWHFLERAGVSPFFSLLLLPIPRIAARIGSYRQAMAPGLRAKAKGQSEEAGMAPGIKISDAIFCLEAEGIRSESVINIISPERWRSWLGGHSDWRHDWRLSEIHTRDGQSVGF